MNHAPANKIIKICHVLSRFEVGGLENGVANLCNTLALCLDYNTSFLHAQLEEIRPFHSVQK